MENNPSEPQKNNDLFARADWYDKSINWDARLTREIPVLVGVFGPPGRGGLIDAGCGTGHQAIILAEKGYRVVGLDSSDEMLDVARRYAVTSKSTVEFVSAKYESIHEKLGSGHDGIYCLANALAAAGSSEGIACAVNQFSKCLRTGGKMFVQILNFAPMHEEILCVRGPRVSTIEGQEYISVRQFHFESELVRVSNVTMWNDNGWKMRSFSGQLYPIELDELRTFCVSSKLQIDEIWGSYAKEPFDVVRSVDLIVVASKTEQVTG